MAVAGLRGKMTKKMKQVGRYLSVHVPGTVQVGYSSRNVFKYSSYPYAASLMNRYKTIYQAYDDDDDDCELRVRTTKRVHVESTQWRG